MPVIPAPCIHGSPRLMPSVSPRLQRRQRRRRCCSPATPAAFMGPALDMPSLVPGWLIPSWIRTSEAESPRDAVRRRRLEQLRGLLAASRRQPPLELPADDVPALADDGSGGAPSAPDGAHTASNAVPFHPGGSGGSLPTALGVPGSAAGSAASSRVERARQVLPWLYAAEGRLDCAAMESLASQLALSGLQLLDVSRYVAAASGTCGRWHGAWGGHIRWAGPPGMPSPVVAAAAALRRMELRRGGALAGVPQLEGKVVVLAYQPQHRQVAAEALALYLHAYLGASGREAVAAAGQAVGASPLEATLRASLEELAAVADGWRRRVTLSWPYAGGHAEVVGEAVGGWDRRAPMVFDVQRKRWRLQIWGLPPGVHRFKYLVDGRWVIDLAGDTEADASGNTNNVVVVPDAGRQPPRAPRRPALACAGAAAAAADGAAAAAVMVTAGPRLSSEDSGDEGAAEAAVAAAKPWSSVEEMEAMARFGAACMAFHTRLGLQFRHVLH